MMPDPSETFCEMMANRVSPRRASLTVHLAPLCGSCFGPATRWAAGGDGVRRGTCDNEACAAAAVAALTPPIAFEPARQWTFNTNQAFDA